MGTPARPPAQRDRRRVARVRRGDAPPPGRDRGPRRARHHDPSLTLIDVWTYGAQPDPRALRGPPDRLVRRVAARRPRGQPVRAPGGRAKLVVDMNTMELLEIQDGPDPGFPPVMGEYAPAHDPRLRRAPPRRPLQVVQPEGASFTLDGHALSWESWRMRLGFTYREGLVLHEVGGPTDRRRGRRQADRAPALVRRDGRALPRPEPGARAARRSTSASGAWAS